MATGFAFRLSGLSGPGVTLLFLRGLGEGGTACFSLGPLPEILLFCERTPFLFLEIASAL